MSPWHPALRGRRGHGGRKRGGGVRYAPGSTHGVAADPSWRAGQSGRSHIRGRRRVSGPPQYEEWDSSVNREVFEFVHDGMQRDALKAIGSSRKYLISSKRSGKCSNLNYKWSSLKFWKHHLWMLHLLIPFLIYFAPLPLPVGTNNPKSINLFATLAAVYLCTFRISRISWFVT